MAKHKHKHPKTLSHRKNPIASKVWESKAVRTPARHCLFD